MIKANELRIGNYHETVGWSSVKVNDKSFSAMTSYGIYLVEQWENTGEGMKFEFKPIAITLEWLKKLGFKDRSGSLNNQLGWGLDVNDFFEIAWFEFYPNGLRFQTKSTGFSMVLKCEYIHELQNLYFALTKEDLNIQ